MDYLTYTNRLEYLSEMINKKQLSSPAEAAELFDCSEKTIRNMINRLREKGFNIKYDREEKKYLINNF
jgi:DeoR/GlpR family transcriptional regulator of sugar metabolism